MTKIAHWPEDRLAATERRDHEKDEAPWWVSVVSGVAIGMALDLIPRFTGWLPVWPLALLFGGLLAWQCAKERSMAGPWPWFGLIAIVVFLIYQSLR